MSSDFEFALRELAKRDVPVTSRLLGNLSNPDRAEVEAFVAWLGQLELDRKREILLRMVEVAEDDFAMDFVALFRRCLNDSDAIVRRHAIEGLWEDESASLVEPLIKMLATDPDVAVRAAAATALGRFVFLAECDELDQRRGNMVRAALERTIADTSEDHAVVRRAVEAIAFINDKQVRRIIDWAYASEDPAMRESAIFAMGRSADPFWAETVLAELDDTSPSMRYEAARACGEMQLKRAVDRLIQLAMDPDREVQAVAVWALGQIGGKRARQALEQWAESDDEVLAVEASEALEELQFSGRPMDLFVYEADEATLFDEDDEDEDDEEDLSDSDDEEWDDEGLIDLDE